MRRGEGPRTGPRPAGPRAGPTPTAPRPRRASRPARSLRLPDARRMRNVGGRCVPDVKAYVRRWGGPAGQPGRSKTNRRIAYAGSRAPRAAPAPINLTLSVAERGPEAQRERSGVAVAVLWRVQQAAADPEKETKQAALIISSRTLHVPASIGADGSVAWRGAALPAQAERARASRPLHVTMRGLCGRMRPGRRRRGGTSQPIRSQRMHCVTI